MNPFSVLLFFLLPSLYFCTNEFRHHVKDTREKVTPEDLTSEALGALRSFNHKTVPYPFLASTHRNAVLADPLTLATFWALVNERVFDVETEDLIKAVGLPADRIAPVYALLNNYLNQDLEFLSTNAIFSDLENSTSSSGIDKLRTYFETVDLRREGDAAVQKINDYIDDHTNGALRDQLLPTNNPFSKSTRGAILSTVNYRRVFGRPLGQGPKIPFQVTPEEQISVDTVEIVSDLKICQDVYTKIVVIPLKSETKKSIILVHPKNMSSFLQNDFDTFTKQVDSISRYDSTKLPYFQTRPLRVRIPSFNVTMARTLQELEQPTKIVSTSTAICDTATTHASFLQHPVQVSRVSLSRVELTMTSVIGAQVDNVDEYRKELGAGSHNPTPDIHITTESRTNNKQAPVQLRSDVGQEQQIYVHVQHEARSGDSLVKSSDDVRDDITVDSPFLLAMHDYDVGMHSFFIISRPQSELEGCEEKFTEHSKLKRWLCIAPPAPPGETN